MASFRKKLAMEPMYALHAHTVPICKPFLRNVVVWCFQGHAMGQLAKVCEQCARRRSQAGRCGVLCHFMPFLNSWGCRLAQHFLAMHLQCLQAHIWDCCGKICQKDQVYLYWRQSWKKQGDSVICMKLFGSQRLRNNVSRKVHLSWAARGG